jgi:carbon monoxide dehydrogenase subunit G
MKLSGSAELHAPVDRVYAAIADPAVLVRAIPGCQQLETVGPDDYRMTITAGVASIKGTYIGSVHIVDQDPPHAYTLKASGQSAAGTVDASARIQLAPNGNGTTRLEYDADALVGGAIGGVGQRMITGVAKKLAGEFFTAVDRELQFGPQEASVAPEFAGPTAAPSVAAPVAVAASPVQAGGVYRRPQPPEGPPADPLLLLAAGALGAVVALAGVALGARICRRTNASAPAQ